MRLFIAIRLNEEIKDHLMKAIHLLKCRASSGNYSHRDNLHLTLVFLGEVGTDRLEDIRAAMNRVKGESFLLQLAGFGRFKRHGGDIHWAGVEKNEMLLKIQHQMESELRKTGFSLEERAFSPHLTLGREIRLPELSPDMFGTILDCRPEMSVSKISLMKSERINGKLTYTEIYGKDLR